MFSKQLLLALLPFAAARPTSHSENLQSRAVSLDQYITSQNQVSFKGAFANIGTAAGQGTKAGVIVASPSKVDPDYVFTWTRDSALTTHGLLEVSDPGSQQDRTLYSTPATTSRPQAIDPASTGDNLVMLSSLPFALVGSLLLLQSTVSALPTSEAPTCAIKCFQKKVEEGEYLAPGAKGLKGLCADSHFVAAYNTCINDNCKEAYLEDAYHFGVNVCTGKFTTSANHGDSSTSRNLSNACDPNNCSSTSSSSSSLEGSNSDDGCTCTQSTHQAAPTQIYVGNIPLTNPTNSSSTSSSVTETATALSQPSPTSTSGASTLAIGASSFFLTVLAASLI